ncbi:MAG: carboxypeptidase-like regulatory domain-containing protein [Bacteroidales bacterium]|nr:carboxypeptidase-like regulatory domain-containing protein [Bacteroidales bacterium]
MKAKLKIITYLFFILIVNKVFAEETEIKGKITDSKTGEAMVGVHITLRDAVHGTVTGSDGTFILSTPLQTPLGIHISYVGYVPLDIEVTTTSVPLDIKMEEQFLLGQEVVISASRIEENILRSAVSIEKMNIRDLKMISAANFYDGLYQLKGVDMNVHGLTFNLPNTRGFNDYTNYRMNQIIDGVENVSPGLSFSAGNIFGLPQIDVKSIEMVVGASTALYGPGGMNGTLVMQSKSPFENQGLSVSAQSGMMNIDSYSVDQPTPMFDFNIRYAKAFSNRMALKVTASYLTATDWHADDTRDRSDLNNPSLTRFTNPGYDGVNTYGDESLVSLNLKDVAPQVINGIAESQGITPGSPEYESLYNKAIVFFPDQLVTRTGWIESDLADDKTKNLRLTGSLHYFINERTEVVGQGNYAMGTSVYTAQNRFAARQFSIVSGKVEINNPNYYARAWAVTENSGSSYDIGGAALRLNEAWKPSEEWFSDYLTAYTQTALISGDMNGAHQFARLVSDNRDLRTGIVFDPSRAAFPLAGSSDFNTLMNGITSRSIDEGGARVYDNSKLYQVEGMYNFTHLIHFMELQVGVSNRVTSVNSNGTVFYDTPGHPININQFGTFIQINKDLLHDRLRITGAFRFDRNEFFKAQYTPRFSLIGFLDKKKEHSIRGTFQTAYRFPSIADQWVDINAGVFRTIGGMKEVQDSYHFNTIPLYPMSGRNPVKDKPVTENGPIILPGLSPEKVESSEIGYKGLFLGKKLFLDSYVYYNKYKGFEAVQLVAQLAADAGTEKDQLFQTYFTTDKPVSSFGWAVSLDYMTPIGMLIKSNVAFNKLLKGIDDPGVEARFNSPDYRANLSVGHHAIIPNLGFNLNLHWQNGFLWESGFGAGYIPAFTTLDAHVAYKVSAIKTTFKLGGSNILNKYYTTSFGSAQIGGLFYISLVYEDILDYITKK